MQRKWLCGRRGQQCCLYMQLLCPLQFGVVLLPVLEGFVGLCMHASKVTVPSFHHAAMWLCAQLLAVPLC
jgi:hypothetical protein